MTDTPPTEPTPTPVKPGWKTSEFGLSLLATLLTYLFASGLLTSNTSLAIAGMAATVLTALGYKVSRTLVKTAGALMLVGLLAAPQLACGNPEARGRAAGGALLACETPIAISTALQLKTPLLEALMSAASGDGLHVDTAKLKAIAAPLWAPELRCALEAAIAYMRTPPAPKPGAPAAAPFAVDPAALGAAWASVRAELAWPAAGP